MASERNPQANRNVCACHADDGPLLEMDVETPTAGYNASRLAAFMSMNRVMPKLPRSRSKTR